MTEALTTRGNTVPGRTVVGIHAVDLSGVRTLHCLTQQEPPDLFLPLRLTSRPSMFDRAPFILTPGIASHVEPPKRSATSGTRAPRTPAATARHMIPTNRLSVTAHQRAIDPSDRRSHQAINLPIDQQQLRPALEVAGVCHHAHGESRNSRLSSATTRS